MVNVKGFYFEVNLNSEGFLPTVNMNYYQLYFTVNVKDLYFAVNLNKELYTRSEFERVSTLQWIWTENFILTMNLKGEGFLLCGKLDGKSEWRFIHVNLNEGLYIWFWMEIYTLQWRK
jgi:hypothetical protein